MEQELPLVAGFGCEVGRVFPKGARAAGRGKNHTKHASNHVGRRDLRASPKTTPPIPQSKAMRYLGSSGHFLASHFRFPHQGRRL